MISRKENKFFFSLALFGGGLFSGLLFILHHLVIWYRLFREGKPWSFFSFVNPDPLVNLAPMIRDVLDGHIWISDGRIWENIYLPNLWSALDPLLIAPLTLLTRSVSWTLLVGHFLAAAATFLVVYFLGKRLTGSRSWGWFFSILFGSAPLLGYYLFPTSLFNIKLVGRTILPLGSPPGEILMSKYVSFSVLPALPIFALALFLLFVALERKERKFTIAAGLAQGLLIYVYLTDVMYLFVSMGIMALIFLLRREFAQVKKLIAILSIALVASLGYWLNFLYINFLPWADEFPLRLGGETTRQFRVSQWKEYLAYAAFACVLWLLAKKMKKERTAAYLIGLALSGIFLLNLQVFIGYNPAPTVWAGHQMYFGFFLGWLVFARWLYLMLRERQERGAKAFARILALLVLMVAARIIYTEVFIASYLYPAHTVPGNISQSLKWLQANTETDSVVVTPSLTSNALLPVFTHNNVIMPVAVTSAASQAEILDRLFVAYSLYGVPKEHLRAALEGKVGKIDSFAFNHEDALPTWLFESYYVDHSIDGYFFRRTAEIPPEVVTDILAGYGKYPKRPSYLLNRYRADYLYVGPYERNLSEADFDKAGFLEKKYEENGVAIYKIKQHSGIDPD